MRVVSFVLKTWNCFGAAQNARAFLRWRGIPDGHRLAHPAVVSAVSAADVVCMQEVFLSEAESFFDGLAHAHKTRDHNKNTWWPLTFGGSGLGLASRFSMVERRLRPFRGPHVGAERFARKGMLHARLEIPQTGTHVDVVTTHLQSGYDEKARQVRARQLVELRELVDEVGSPDRAFFVCGDLNIDGLASSRNGEYAALRAVLHDFVDLGERDDHPTFCPDPALNSLAHRYETNSPAQRIDYVLFRPSRHRDVEPEAFETVLREPISAGAGQTTFPSDHFGLRVRLRAMARAHVAARRA